MKNENLNDTTTSTEIIEVEATPARLHSQKKHLTDATIKAKIVFRYKQSVFYWRV